MSQPAQTLHQATAITGADPFATRIETGVAETHAIASDAPAEHGGQGRGPSPVDLLTAALASCKSMTASMYARRKGWPVESIAFDVRHVRRATDDGKPRDAFVCVMTITGDLDEEQRRKVYEISGRCPVHLMLAQKTIVESSLAEV
ncbi:MAG: OsmC family protein [Planctomycetota bacterium]